MKTRLLLQELHNKSKFNDHALYGGKIPFVFTQALENPDLDISRVVNLVNKKIPEYLFYGIDGIYMGHLPEFDKRNINAMYNDGAIYVTNRQQDELDMFDDIVHELAHAAERRYSDIVYGDGELELEFLKKRKMLYNVLRNYEENVPKKEFLETEFSSDFDNYLYKVVGYSKLSKYIGGIFTSNYSATSLSEYFSVNFTDYFIKDKKEIKEICPVAYTKIKTLAELDQEGE